MSEKAYDEVTLLTELKRLSRPHLKDADGHFTCEFKKKFSDFMTEIRHDIQESRVNFLGSGWHVSFRRNEALEEEDYQHYIDDMIQILRERFAMHVTVRQTVSTGRSFHLDHPKEWMMKEQIRMVAMTLFILLHQNREYSPMFLPNINL